MQTLLLGPPRSGTTILLRSVARLAGLTPVSEPRRVWQDQRRNVIPDALGANRRGNGRLARLRGFRARRAEPLRYAASLPPHTVAIKETVSFHADDPVTAAVRELVERPGFATAFHALVTIRHPAAICLSIQQRFRDDDAPLEMDDETVLGVVDNVNRTAAFAARHGLPLVPYETWVHNPDTLHGVLWKAGPREQAREKVPGTFSAEGRGVAMIGTGDAAALAGGDHAHADRVDAWRERVPGRVRCLVERSLSDALRPIYGGRRAA